MAGSLYFLVNDAMPGLVKIGHTTGELDVRLQQLHATGVPVAFRVVALFHVSDSAACEAAVHQKLHSYRTNPRREFFSGTPQLLIAQSLETINLYLCGSALAASSTVSPVRYAPDKDDIYFMFFLLHDGYQQRRSYSSADLAEHHHAYSVIELDLKLLNLEVHGLVKRVNRLAAGVGEWMLTPNGAKFMIEGGHHDQQLLDASKEA